MIRLRALAPLAAILLLLGCGGKSGGGGSSAPANRAGSAKISIVWPVQARVIPSTANRVIVTLASASKGYSKEVLLSRPPEGSPTQISEADFGYLTAASDYKVRARAFAETATTIGELVSALPLADSGPYEGSLEIIAGQTTKFTVTMQSQLAAVRVTGLDSSLPDGSFLVDAGGAFRESSGGGREAFSPRYNLAKATADVILTPLGIIPDESHQNKYTYSDLNLFVYNSGTQFNTVELQPAEGLGAFPVSSKNGAVTFTVSLDSLGIDQATLKIVYREDGQAVKTFQTVVNTKPQEGAAEYVVSGLPLAITSHPGEFRVVATLQEDTFNGVTGPSYRVTSDDVASNKITFPLVKNRGRDFTRTLVYEVKPVGAGSNVYTPLFTVTDRVTTAKLFVKPEETAPAIINASYAGDPEKGIPPAMVLSPFTLTTKAFTVSRGGTLNIPNVYSPVYLAQFAVSGATFQLPSDLFTIAVNTLPPTGENPDNGSYVKVVGGDSQLRLPIGRFKRTTDEPVQIGVNLAGPTATSSFSDVFTITIAANAGNVTGGVH